MLDKPGDVVVHRLRYILVSKVEESFKKLFPNLNYKKLEKEMLQEKFNPKKSR